MLTEHLIRFFVLFALGYAIGWLITHAGLKREIFNKTCRNCFWLYNSQGSVFCSDPDTPVRFLDRSLIKKFHCSRWSGRKS